MRSIELNVSEQVLGSRVERWRHAARLIWKQLARGLADTHLGPKNTGSSLQIFGLLLANSLLGPESVSPYWYTHVGSQKCRSGAGDYQQ